MAPSSTTTSTSGTRPSSPERGRPSLPPRPSEHGLLQSRPTTSHQQASSLRPSLASTATTAVSTTDVNTYHRPDGTQEVKVVPSRGQSSRSIYRYGSNKNSEVGEDTSSIRSYLPFRTARQDSESIFGGALDDGLPTLINADDQDFFRNEGMYEEIDFQHEFENIEDTTDTSEEHAQALWKQKKKHYLILSAAGKPIYTRHGSDQTISSYLGIIQTIISSYDAADDPLRSFQAGHVKFVILAQTNLFLVAISALSESDAQLRAQLDAMYMQILSTLTLPPYSHLLADSFTKGSPSTLLSALECLKIRKSHRNVINSTLVRARVDDLLYGLVVAGGRLVSVIRPKKHSLHPGDLQLIFNMLFEAEAIKAGGGDSWIPICLPGFNKTGYLFMYVSYISTSGAVAREVEVDEKIAKEDAVAIILLSANKESFESMQSMKRYLVHEFTRTGSMRVIQSALQAARPSPTDIVPGTGVRHFLFKSRGNVQFFMPSLSPHYDNLNRRRQLMTIYHQLHASVHAKHASVKVHHSVSSVASALAWVTPLFELYCVAGPTMARNALAQSANRIVQWVQREEERVFIIGGAVF
ncbi:Vacuolar fusion protein MON1 [Cyphellophora attinorum]|uniref:Vacuolar fusion protein MON1 n=1 Tax=Cyphellophora attinorum TaxID=1664694 RepID=A0A0N1HPW1_9EURO|nr:Vacuolar fusion protein MON1 [Phialophora attinorum]KPI39856.1 Vacuolar fusion protein MON1 [Phialophora attinorum]